MTDSGEVTRRELVGGTAAGDARMGTFVTLAEVLEARGSPLEEEEVWCLLLATTEALLDISKKDVASFTAPELQQGLSTPSRAGAEKMVVYSLGMTLYWCVDYHLPQNQPVQMSPELESLLLSMCEDVAVRRTDLLTLLETCELHHKTSMLPPAERLIKQLVDDVCRNSVDLVSMAENGSPLTDRSQVVRDRLHMSGKLVLRRIPAGGRIRDSYPSWHHLNRSPCGPYIDVNRTPNSRSLTQFESTTSLNDKKLKDVGPEFTKVLDEPTTVLELPGSILSKKGKSPSTLRELSVVMPNGQTITVKCDVKSRGGDVFDMIVAHSNLGEHFYFGLAYIDDNEFFFVENDTKICKVAPDSWKKVPTTTFVLFFRIKFFVNNVSLLLHKQTRHQYYLQFRRDLLEDRLSCHEETALCLGGLALQTEYGDCMPEVVYGRNYFRPDQYVSKSVMEKRALPYVQAELLRHHANNAQMLADESELEFLKVCQQLPEYGVFFHRVMRDKKPSDGEIILGVCAKGVSVYGVKDGCRFTAQNFFWRETATISSNRRKFVIECRGSKKKYTFVTDRSKVAQYLCNLCSSQHKFNNEMNSRQLSHSLVSEDNIVQYAAACRAQSSPLKSFSCSETPQDDSGQTTPREESLTKLCDDITARIEARVKQQRWITSTTPVNFTRVGSDSSDLRRCQDSPEHLTCLFTDTPTKLGAASEREVICVTLKKDPKLGLGIVIVGEDTVGRYDLGIFIASIVPGGPADKDGRIKAGGRLISLDHVSLEGVTFNEAAEVMQNSPEEVQLIVSQPKVPVSPNCSRSPVLGKYEPQTPTDGRSANESSEEFVSAMMTPKSGHRLNVPQEARVQNSQDGVSLSTSLNSVRPEEIAVQLKKISGNLGISISGGVNPSLPHGGIYIKSLVPGGAAERDGRLHPGDRLLEVDGVNFSGLTYQQAVESLSQTDEVVGLVVERESANLPRVSVSAESSSIMSNQSLSPARRHLRLNSSSTISNSPSSTSERTRDFSFVTDENTQEVTLTKSSNSLGFSFLMCELDPPTRDFSSMVRIKQLFPGQPAERSGRIREGDVLLAVNGQSLKELSYPKVLKLFKTSPPEVRLKLCRPPPEGDFFTVHCVCPAFLQGSFPPWISSADRIEVLQNSRGTRRTRRTSREFLLKLEDDGDGQTQRDAQPGICRQE
ncbi:FERM and PDZ domain-containing protein 2, partial [Oryzias melastigma]